MRKRVLVYIAVILLVAYFFGMLISQQIKIGEKEKEIESLNSEIKDVRSEIENIKDEIANSEDRETIERIAREYLDLIYPDERKYEDSSN